MPSPLRIESLSIRAVTIAIFAMIGVVALVLSLLAGSYFRQAALDAQMNSLSRVIEVAAQEMLREVRGYTFDLGMKLGNSDALTAALGATDDPAARAHMVALLDDPFVNGFVGFADINLEKIRVYDRDLNLVAESARGLTGLAPQLADHLAETIAQRPGVDRLKAVDALWISSAGPLHSTVVPVGGLRPLGYLEIVINPAFNLPDIGNITKTPISIFSMTGEPVIGGGAAVSGGHLPVEYVLFASDGQPAFRIVGYEDVRRLNAEMERTQWVTTAGFLLLTTGTLLFALWLFSRFLFVPVGRMITDMRRMADGELDLRVNKRGLRDFSILAETFDAMARQVRLRTRDLERLLDVDDSAILCFGRDREAVYLNRGALRLFGYARDEIADLELGDLFTEDIAALMDDAGRPDAPRRTKLHARLHCVGKDGMTFPGEAVVSTLDVQGGHGYAIVLNAQPALGYRLAEDVATSVQRNAQRMEAVEQSLNSLLEMARNRTIPLPVEAAADPADPVDAAEQDAGAARPPVCARAVAVMHAALACWEHDLGRSKLDLAEASRIWPVYIDKSTPTTRTLDRYLNIETCPKKPRTQRVIDTAEFVLRQADRKTPARRRLQQALDDFRLSISGMRPS
ncbi:MAG: PAS domain-containing protein [Pseudomonadota bacterium]